MVNPINVTHPELLQFCEMADVLDSLDSVGGDVQRCEFFL